MTAEGDTARDRARDSQAARHDELLRRSEEQFRLLLESVKDYAIFMLDREGHVLTWNSGAQAIKGYAAHEVLGRHFSMFFTAQDVAAGAPAQELAAAARDGRAVTEGWRVRKDGRLFWASVVLTPVLDSEGRLRGFAKVTRDLSEQRRLSELERSNQRTHEFIAMLAHELRNPLAPIRNAVSILQAHRNLPQPVHRVGEVIGRQITHLTRLVDDLLDVGRIVTGKIVLKHDRIDYGQVVINSVEAVRPSIDDRHHRLLLDLPDEPIAITGDATRLAQALQNLLQNASRYTPEGGEIEVRARLEEQHVVTTVRDNGVGIASDAIDRIFGLFAQEHRNGSGHEGGLGIGLPLARSLIEQHGGRLTAASAGIGQGSTFTVVLPLRERSMIVAPGALEGAESAGAKPLRVLVVDDNADSADTMVDLLMLLGHEARSVYGARQAIETSDEFRPQLVLLDLNMPDGDGFSVLRRLRERTTGALYVVAMTGYGQKEDRDQTMAAGFQAHLTKPVGPELLQRTLDDASRALAS
jgi:PAS domain S-box-containing protein